MLDVLSECLSVHIHHTIHVGLLCDVEDKMSKWWSSVNGVRQAIEFACQ